MSECSICGSEHPAMAPHRPGAIQAARAEIARLEKELAECREELEGAVLIGREDRLRATEAERELRELRAVVGNRYEWEDVAQAREESDA